MKTDMIITLWHQMQLGLDPENEYPSDEDIQVLTLDFEGNFRVVRFMYRSFVDEETTLKNIFFAPDGTIIDVMAWAHIRLPLF